MAFFRPPQAKSDLRLGKKDLVIAVGWHAYVNCPDAKGRRGDSAPMTNASGVPLPSDLADGEEVQITAWRHHSRHGLSYEIRRISDGCVGWVSSLHLRRTSDAVEATS